MQNDLTKEIKAAKDFAEKEHKRIGDINLDTFTAIITNVVEKNTPDIKRLDWLMKGCIIGLEVPKGKFKLYMCGVGKFFGDHKKKEKKVVKKKVVKKNKKSTSSSTKNRIQRYFELDPIGALHYGES
ncbi:hypothetical protein HOG29_02355 [bacterium]|nr:hypothetical protein [bacterium]